MKHLNTFSLLSGTCVLDSHSSPSFSFLCALVGEASRGFTNYPLSLQHQIFVCVIITIKIKKMYYSNFRIVFSEMEIKKAVLNSENKKAPGCDGIFLSSFKGNWDVEKGTL